MLLTQTAEYAFRAMAHLALLPQGEKIGARNLSEVTHIPIHYLSKIMRRLVRHNLVQAQKGHGGGFILNRQPGQIHYQDILDAVDFPFDADHCVFGWKVCRSSHPCPLHHSWVRIKEEFQRWSETTTLAEVKNPPPLVK
jgi:Rrf2 family transcriptional regulator, iron-sulfur cluster assembly transcription factor